ncbi:MAG: response regulator, partial [Patescibacteria group bacterium]|nr:response regulator [Patescibacteria group bacterium]
QMSHGSMLQIRIADTGIGMSEIELARIFSPFMQADTSTSRQFGGTGLGLTISKRLAELLGGDVTVQSTLGKGSVFTVTVPTGSSDGVRMVENPGESHLGSETDQFAGKCPATSLRGMRLLLAEDGCDNQRLISTILTRMGADVVLATNGQIAVEHALASRDAGNPFDAILMDMQMPVLDGYQATRRLRKEEWSHPIIALTANAMREDRQKCLDIGCDGYLSKPIDRRQLLDVLTQLVHC